MPSPVCQHCRTPATPPDLATPAGPEQDRCAHCGAFFQVEWFPAAWRDSRAEVRPEARQAGGSACFHHPGHQAVAACGRCGRFLCPLCRIDFRGRLLCGDCIEALRSSGKPEYQARRLRHDRLVEIILLAGTVPMVTAGPTALLCIILCLVFRRRRGVPPTRFSPMWRPLLVSVLVLMLYIGIAAIWSTSFP